MKRSETENILMSRIDFVVFISVTNANPNGDPLMGNYPRIDTDGYGLISANCIKRKIRNRQQDMGESIFVQSDDRIDDEYTCLKDRAKDIVAIKDPIEAIAVACEKWIDVRTFGQPFAFEGEKNGDEGAKSKKKGSGVSISVRGPVSINIAKSVDVVDVETMKITKSTNGNQPLEKGKGSDTMGDYHYVKYGLYKIFGSINPNIAEKTDFTVGDAEILKEAIKTLFENDESAARPSGSMVVERIYWFDHGSKNPKYNSATVNASVSATLKDGIISPKSTADYEFSMEELPELEPEIIIPR